jgi:hypothetical protein
MMRIHSQMVNEIEDIRIMMPLTIGAKRQERID